MRMHALPIRSYRGGGCLGRVDDAGITNRCLRWKSNPLDDAGIHNTLLTVPTEGREVRGLPWWGQIMPVFTIRFSVEPLGYTVCNAGVLLFGSCRHSAYVLLG